MVNQFTVLGAARALCRKILETCARESLLDRASSEGHVHDMLNVAGWRAWRGKKGINSDHDQ